MENNNLPQKNNHQNNLQPYTSFSKQLGIRIDFKTKRKIIHEEEHQHPVKQIVFTEKQEVMLTSDKNKVLIRNVKNNRILVKLPATGHTPCFQLSKNEDYLILNSAFNTIEIVDTKNWNSMQKIEFDEEIIDFKFFDSCKKIVAGSHNKLVILDAFTKNHTKPQTVLNTTISKLHKINNNTLFVAGKKDKICLIDVNSEKILWQYKYTHLYTDCFYYDSNEKQLLFPSENHQIAILNIKNLKISREIKIHQAAIIKITIIGKKKLLLTQSEDNKMVISDFTNGKIMKEIRNTNKWSPFQLSPDQNHLLLRLDKTLFVYNTSTLKQVYKSQVMIPNFTAAFIPGTTIIWMAVNTLGKIPGRVFKIDFKTGTENLFNTFETMVNLLQCNSDYSLLACGCSTGKLFLLNLQNEKPVCNETELMSKKCKVTYIKEHQLLVVIHNHKVVVWDTVELLPKYEFSCSAFPESKIIAHGKDFMAFNSKDHILFYNIARNKITYQYPDPYARVSFHPEKKQVIIASLKSIILFDYTNWKEINKRDFFAQSVYYSAKGKFIFASPPKNDNQVYILSPDLHDTIRIINQPGGHINKFCHIPETKTLIWNNFLENTLIFSNLEQKNGSKTLIIRNFAVSENKKLLYGIENKKHLQCYYTSNFQLKYTIYQSNSLLSQTALSEKNGLLAFYEWKAGVHVFDTQNRQMLYKITVNECIDLIFLYSGTVLLINQGGFMTFYDTATGMQLCTKYHLNTGYLLHTPPDESNRYGWFSTNKPEMLNIYKTKPDGSASEIIQDDSLQHQQILSGVINHQMVKNKIMNPIQYKKDMKTYKKAENETARNNAMENKKMERKFLK